MNIYRIEVKDELYFLNDKYEKNLIYSSIKDALKENNRDLCKGYTNEKQTVAFKDFMTKLGTVKNKQLLEKYSDGKVEEKKEEPFYYTDMGMHTFDPLQFNYSTTLVNTPSGGLSYWIENSEDIVTNSIPENEFLGVTINPAEQPVVSATTWHNSYENQRVVEDIRRNAEYLREQHDRFNRGQL